MSETVHYKGQIKKVEIPSGFNLNSYAEKLCKEFDIRENDYWKKYGNGNYGELLTDDREEYLLVKDELYEVLTKNHHELDEEIANITPNGDGTYDYEVRYYNGGAGFSEMIEECFDKLQ